LQAESLPSQKKKPFPITQAKTESVPKAKRLPPTQPQSSPQQIEQAAQSLKRTAQPLARTAEQVEEAQPVSEA
jgi:hypothetical protein